MTNPFESITEKFFEKRIAEFNKTGLSHYNDEFHFTPSFFDKFIDKSANLLRHIPVLGHLIGPPLEHQGQLNKLLVQQKLATSYHEWFEISSKLDVFLENDEWKQDDVSPLYDYKLIRERLHQLRVARDNHDYLQLLYLVRTTWTRNLGNMGNVNLYRHSHVGTKKLIEEYIEECELVLDELTSASCPLDDRYILSMLLQTRKLIGRTALVLSGGGCFGLFHIGVLANLLELNLLPRIISGSSAGAIIASILCVQSQEETLKLISTIEKRNFDIFESSSNKEYIFLNLARFLKHGTWFDNKYLQETMIEFLGDLTFRESYNRTGRILNVTVSPASIHEQPTLLNYLTSPNVLIWSAVCASCSLPGVFPSSTIYEKTVTGKRQEWNHTSVKFVDGSVDNDLPITRLSEMFNVDHIIACQCNPHVVPFLKMSIECVGGEIENEISAKFKKFLNLCYDLTSSEIMHYLEILSELGIFKNICTKLRSVIAQQYSGDITILPDLRLTEINKILSNPTPKFLLDATVRGARATWPKLTLIKNHCSIEFALDKSISILRSRLISTRIASTLPLINSPSLLQPEDLLSVDSELDNFKVTVSSSSSSSHHNRHRSETLNVADLAQEEKAYLRNHHHNQHTVHYRQSPRIRYKNSLPSLHNSSTKLDKLLKKKRRITLPSQQMEPPYTSPSSLANTQPPSPYHVRTSRINSASSLNKNHLRNIKKSKINNEDLNSRLLKTEAPTNIDPNDDDVIIRQITDLNEDDYFSSEAINDEDDSCTDGYNNANYNLGGLTTPKRGQ